MLDFIVVEVSQTPYLYVERTSPLADVATAMRSAFDEVWNFMQGHGVAPVGGALALYYEYPADGLTFRAGFAVRERDLASADGPVKGDLTPKGHALHFTHRGSYDGLAAAYAGMMSHMQTHGLAFSPPTWEVYVNTAGEVHDEQLVTECFQALAV